VYRLATNPRRVWLRYLVEPWVVFMFLVARALKRRRGLGFEAGLET
jgi:UDP-N-acetyl-D-mannosaminuronic acid transferase (WecB/TagA/CpsF family)